VVRTSLCGEHTFYVQIFGRGVLSRQARLRVQGRLLQCVFFQLRQLDIETEIGFFQDPMQARIEIGVVDISPKLIVSFYLRRRGAGHKGRDGIDEKTGLRAVFSNAVG
jgi:hypothetical protein